MGNNASIMITVGAKAANAISEFKQLNRGIGDSLTGAQKFGVGVRKALVPAIAAFGALSAVVAQGVKGLAEDEEAFKKLDQILKTTKNSVGITTDAFWEYANQLQDTTGVSAAVITSNAAILATFKDVKNSVGDGNKIFDRATVAALDMSKAFDQDLKASTVQLGKALNDPIKGVGALARVGVSFTQKQKDQIKVMVESGNVLGAQKIILGELEGQVGGTANAYGETMAGKVERAKRAWEEIQKELASAVLPVLEKLLSIGRDVLQWARDNAKLVKILAGVIGGLSAAIIVLNAGLKAYRAFATAATVATTLFNTALRANPIGIVITALAALAAGLVLAYKNSETFRNWVQSLWDKLKAFGQAIAGIVQAIWDNGLKQMFNNLKAAFDLIIALLKGAWKKAWESVKTLISGVVSFIISKFTGLPSALLALGQKLVDAGKTLGSKLLSGIKNALGSLASWIWEAIKDIPGKLWNAIKRTLRNGWPDIPGLPNPFPESWGRSAAPIQEPSRLYQNRGVDINNSVQGATRSPRTDVISEEQIARAIQQLLLRSDARNGRMVYVGAAT